MKPTIPVSITAVIALYAHIALATVSYCPNNNVCFQWGVPEAAATSGSGDVYFQIEAPTSYQWIGLGIGSGMNGADMFLIYQDGNGNVTLSRRSCSGHNMPQYRKNSRGELIGRSGVSNGTMVANIRCGDCTNLDLSGTNSWIAAWKKGNALDSTDLSETIQEHDGYSSFSIDLAKATFNTPGNPFTNSTNSSSGSGVVSESGSGSEHLADAHGIVMAIVFLLGYPIGAVLMPLIGKWLVHAGWQVVVFLGMWVGFGLGYIVSRDDGSWGSDPHTVLGVIVCALLTVQPVLGWLHHQHFVQHQRRGMISYAHIWYGRILMIVGIVNGGLGLKLAQSSQRYIIGYSVITGAMAVVYVAGIFFSTLEKKKKRAAYLLSSQSPSDEGYSLHNRSMAWGDTNRELRNTSGDYSQ